VKIHRAALASAAAAALVLASRAAADACVEIDPERDTLSEQDRAAARSLFLQALESNGQAVATGRNGRPCTAVYRVHNVRIGNSVSATVAGPQGVRTVSVRAVEDLPNVYDQIVRSLLSGDPLSNSSGALTRDNVTANQAAPRRAQADSLWYARLGYGATGGGSRRGGPAIGLGYRHELDRLAIDLSFVNLTFANNDSSSSGDSDSSISGSWLRLVAYYFATPASSSSLYAGAGLSWGGAVVEDEGAFYGGSGIQGELSLGFELLRASTIRLFVQADATFPFYRATSDTDSWGFGGTGDRYTPSFVVSVGGGFGRGHAVGVHVIP
jgi:hypothetical protein